MGSLAIFLGTWSTPEKKHLFAAPTAKLNKCAAWDYSLY
jgi:hypothetical protein